MAKRFRADQLASAQGLAPSADQAARLIMAGKLAFIDASGALKPVDKPGRPFAEGTRFELVGVERFVSRGAYKLLSALEAFSLDVSGLTCLDAGASTGGFTDCLLQHGAAKVYAVDVGKAQLHERLRVDPRVVSLEGVNLRLAEEDLIPEPVDLLVADVSFISLTEILPPCLRWLKTDGHSVVLIKPQFELGSRHTDKGVVRDPLLRQQAVDKVTSFCNEQLGLQRQGLIPAALKGPKGNQEYLGWFVRAENFVQAG